MSWLYNTSNGVLSRNGQEVGTGYSGFGAGVNNVHFEEVHDIGPIPRGRYSISGFFDDPEKGPLVARLTPAEGTETFGRGGFLIHGDNQAMDFTASHGCIILPRTVREAIRDSGDTELEAV